MKKIFLLMSMAATMFAFAGCQKNEVEVPSANEEGSTFELVAEIAQTKTTLDGLQVEWEEGDVIYMVTSDGTWGKAYADDNKGESIADYTYADGKFTTKATIADGDYTFKAMYAAASQRSYHRGASSTHKLEATQTQDCSKPTAHIKANDALVGTFTATTPMIEPARVSMSHLYTMMQVNVKNNTGAPIEVTKFEMTAEGADLAGIFNVTSFETPSITAKEGEASTETITVNVTGDAVAAGEALPVYFVMAPLADYSGDVTFKVTDSEGNTYTKTVTMNGISFEAGKYNTTPYTITEADEVVETLTWDLTKASYSASSTSEVKWTSDYVDMVLAKAGSTTNANNYLGGTNAHTRVYKDQVLTLTAADAVIIKKVEFTVVSGYMDELEGATWTNATKSVSGLVMTVTPNDELLPMSATIGSATRFTSVKVYYELDPNYVAPTLVSIKVDNPKTEYYVDDEFVAPKVIAVYDNDKEYEVNEGVIFSGFDSSDVAEEQEITVAYGGLTTSYTISIVEAPVVGDDPVSSGTILWAETWADVGSTSTTFGNNSAISTYTYAGRSGYGDNATSVTYTADASNNVRITKSTSANCTSGHLWFNKSVAGELKTSAIKLYGATSLTFSHSQGTNGSSCQTLYSTNGGSSWTSLGTQSGPVAKKTYTFTVPEGTESILIKLVHASSNAKNTRVDNLELKVK